MCVRERKNEGESDREWDKEANRDKERDRWKNGDTERERQWVSEKKTQRERSEEREILKDNYMYIFLCLSYLFVHQYYRSSSFLSFNFALCTISYFI